MIEFCSKKRMVIAIVTLITITIISLILETRWSANHQVKEVKRKGKTTESPSETCKSAKLKIEESCRECSNEEMVNEDKYCKETGFKETIVCEDGTKIIRKCPMAPWKEEKKFWIFEGVTLLTGVLAYGLVFIRQQKLDQMLREKINRQIAAGI